MSDLSGLSSIGGTLSALQDTGLREFIETNSGSWTGGVEYSAISGKLAPEDIAVFEFHSDSATFEAISAAYSAGKICFLRTTPKPTQGLYLPLVAVRPRFMSSPGLFGFASISDYNDAWSSKNATFNWYTITDAETGHNAWHSTNQPLVMGEKTAFMFNSAIGYDGDGKISAYNGSAFAGGAGAEYSAGSNIDITDNVISGKDWTSEIAAATSLIPNSIPVKLLTNSVNTSEVTYGDLRALCNGTKVFYIKVPGTPNYGFKIFHPTRCSDWGSHCEVCFTSEPYSPRDEEGDDMNVHNYYEANISFFFMDLRDDGPADTDIAIIGHGWEVNLGVLTEASINPDWNISDIRNPRYIKNKPDLSTYATKTELSSVSGSLTGYQTTAGMTAYIPATVVATSADATGSNILYVVTGE